MKRIGYIQAHSQGSTRAGNGFTYNTIKKITAYAQQVSLWNVMWPELLQVITSIRNFSTGSTMNRFSFLRERVLLYL